MSTRLLFEPFIRAQLCSLLKREHITMQELADRLGIGLRTVSGKLTDRKNPLPLTGWFVDAVLTECDIRDARELFTPILSDREVLQLRRISAGRTPDVRMDRLAARGLVEQRQDRMVLTAEGATALEQHNQVQADESADTEQED